MNAELDRIDMAHDAAQLLRFKRGWSSKLVTEGILARIGCGTVLVAAASLKACELVTNPALGVLHESPCCDTNPVATRITMRHESRCDTNHDATRTVRSSAITVGITPDLDSNETNDPDCARDRPASPRPSTDINDCQQTPPKAREE